MFIMQYAFVRFEDIQGVVLPPGTATYFLVKVAPGADAGAVRRAIEDRWADVDVFTLPEMASNNREVISGSFLPILLVLYVIGFVIGIVVIGLTVYTATMERAREYGVLKAIGAGNARLARVVLTQSAVLAVLGFLAGLAITAIAAAIIDAAVPEMTLYFAPTTFPQVFAAALGMSAVATALPLGRLARIDPASIFRRG
jgi:putative ABC transport system permease protein